MKIKGIIKKTIRKITGSKMRLGNFIIKIDSNHCLPSTLKGHHDYGYNIVRLGKVITKKYKQIKVIDIGANIGDTIAMLLSDNPEYEIISIEGDDKYFKILTENFGKNEKVTIVKNFLSDHSETIQIDIDRSEGTLKLNNSIKNKSKIELITLDKMIDQKLNCKLDNLKLIKIDTDGFDNKIIRGSKDIISKYKPVIFFEYDSKLLKDNNENGVDIFIKLEKSNYTDFIFFDNYGRFLISVKAGNKMAIEQLCHYINDRKGGFAYYDIAAFHNEDSDIAKLFIESEILRK